MATTARQSVRQRARIDNHPSGHRGLLLKFRGARVVSMVTFRTTHGEGINVQASNELLGAACP